MHALAVFALCLCVVLVGFVLWASKRRKPLAAPVDLPDLLQEHDQITDFLDSSDHMFAAESEREFMEQRLAVVEHRIRRSRHARSHAT